MCLKLACCAFSSSPSKDATMSTFCGFSSLLLKFKPFDDFFPSKTWLQISLCLWLEGWIKTSLKLSLALFISAIFKRWKDGSFLSFLFSLCWSSNGLKCDGQCLFLSYCHSCFACERSFLTGKECLGECAHCRSPRQKHIQNKYSEVPEWRPHRL